MGHSGRSGLMSPPTVLESVASLSAPTPYAVAQVVNSTAAAALAAPAATPPQVYRTPRQSRVPPSAWPEQRFPNLALAMAGSLQRSRSLRSGACACRTVGTH